MERYSQEYYDTDERYIDEFGRRLPKWKAVDPDKRGRFRSFAAAAEAAFADLTTERNPFFDSLADVWPKLFPGSPLRPGRYECGLVFLYVRSAAMLFAMRPKLPAIRKTLLELPGAPKKLELRLEIRK